MFSLENLLASRHISKRELKKIHNPNVIFDKEKHQFYLQFEYEVKRKNSDETYLKLYKNNITKLVNEHGSLKNLFLSLIASEMILAGYFIVPVENGWLCVGGSEVYAMKEQECSCIAYLNNPSKPCKHLLYKEALDYQRSCIAKWKRDNL